MPHSTLGRYFFREKSSLTFPPESSVRQFIVFFWILDNFVYNMSNTCHKKAIQNFMELPLSSCFFGIKLGMFTSIQNLGTLLTPAFLGRTANILLPPHLVQSLSLVFVDGRCRTCALQVSGVRWNETLPLYVRMVSE
jgi:hypothetical protein